MNAITLAVAYIIATASPTPGYSLSFNRTGCSIPRELSTSQPPQNIAISPDGGSIAFVEYPIHCGEDRIVVIHDRRRVVITRPEDDTISDDVNDYSISTLLITDTGDLFVTLSDRVSGAYMAVDKRVFVRTKNAWQGLNLTLPDSSGSCNVNTAIGAVETRRRFAVNVDCEDQFLPSFQEAVDPQYATRAVIVDGIKTAAGGLGTITGMSAGEAAGYFDGLHHSTSPSVVLWSGSERRKIGDGVGFGVTSDGTVVGDNRRSWDVPGHPMIWKNRSRVAISSTLRGSAFAIKDDVIVGSIISHAFVAQKKTLPRSLRLLKSEDGKVSILTAFAITKGGRILAIGKDYHGNLLILTLSMRR